MSSRPPSTSPLHIGNSMEQQQQQSWMASSLAEHDRSHVRSSPIAIVRTSSSGGHQRQDADDSDDDDDLGSGHENDVITHMSQLTVGSLPTTTRESSSGWSGNNNMARSMPLAVPRAPYLTSRRSNDDQQQSMPPMKLSEQVVQNNEIAASVPSYGSLRESHLQGRFLDGPASYRDSTSGQVHRIGRKRVVRFDDSSTSYQHYTPPDERNNTMSSWSRQPITKTTPGERMQEARKQRQDSSSASVSSGASPRETSSLSAMMEHASKESSTNNNNNNSNPSSLNHDEEQSNEFGQEQTSMLSTSLTGLEVLQNTNVKDLSLQQEQEKPPRNNNEWNRTEQLVGDEIEDNDALLDRPLSPNHNPDTEEAFDLDLDD